MRNFLAGVSQKLGPLAVFEATATSYQSEEGFLLRLPSRRWELLESCLPMLRRLVRHTAHDADSAHDLFQEACLRILRSNTAPDEAEAFSRWCHGVVRNVAAHQRRRRRSEPISGEEFSAATDQDNAERRVYVGERLARALGRLDPDFVELFVRHYVFEEPISELADERAQSPASLRMRLMRLRAALRANED